MSEPVIGTIAELVEMYSPSMDLVDAKNMAHDQLMEVLLDREGTFTPIELKAVMEQSFSARLDIIVGMYIALVAEVQGWTVDQADRERQTMKDGLLLVKHHVEFAMISSLDEAAELANE